VRNDEQLIKLAAIIQRMMAGKVGADGDGGGMLLTDEERKQLMTTVEETAKQLSTKEVSNRQSK
jgi:hypothetical protein